MRRSRRIASVALAAACAVAVAPACSQGEGEGRITGTLAVPNCWTGPFELSPDFFAGVPYREGLLLRIQSGSDFESFSDGLSILIQDITRIRPNPATGSPGLYGRALEVSLPPEVTPPGVPVKADPQPAMVTMTLYLQRSCRTVGPTLHAMSEVTLPADGTCDAPAVMGADPHTGCDPARESPGGQGSGRSFITFTQVFDGKLDEPTAAERLTSGCFDVYLADPRDVAPGGGGPPPRCRGHIKGSFRFFFERGRPSQPFP